MSTQRTVHKYQVDSINDYNSSFRELRLKALDHQLRFASGQFVMLHVPQTPKPVLRAYSIASDERDVAGFSLLLKKVKDGIASNYVWNLKGGEELQFSGPFGRVLFREPPTEQIIFLCTGSGLSQHLSFLRSKSDRYPNIQYRLLLGLLDESELFFLDGLEKFKKQLPSFHFDIVLSNPGSQWKGLSGFVQHHLHASDFKAKTTTFYLCGNPIMIKETRELLTSKEGVDQSQILAESFH